MEKFSSGAIGGNISVLTVWGIKPSFQPPTRLESICFTKAITICSIRNRSGIIAHEGLPNAKPLIVDFILLLPETNFRLKTNADPK